MEVSEFVAGLAFFISLLAYIETKRANRSQSRLTDREVELVRIQIQTAQNEAKREKTAAVSARLNKVDKSSWKLRVFNTGPAPALNIRLVLDEQNSIIQENSASRKFPMSKLEKGQSVELAAFVHMQSNPKEWLRIRWDDPSGKDRENRIEITI
ncbi:hypothetical protein K3555_16880 [Leisingera sp. M527]|uniref:hypothetical protein n=1 Tax=Leisingera sp. M527 TaxID=2867014 RepID=UPI0021A94DD2|nr:hypothetical protein [Leisingera sp. M527]UWQ32214.1 hypothetical protein K3555_16880 [Leisingera sp. M527]